MNQLPLTPPLQQGPVVNGFIGNSQHMWHSCIPKSGTWVWSDQGEGKETYEAAE